MIQVGNIEIELTKDCDLVISNGTNVIKVESNDVDDFIQRLIDEAW